MRNKANFLMALTLALAVCGAARADAAQQPAAQPATQSALWKVRKADFSYQGFTTRYSCDGLREKIRQVLLALGARADVGVSVYGCSHSFGGPSRYSSLKLKMAVLQPVPSAAPGTVPAVWRKVNLGGANVLDAGDCELAEQIKRKILPLFAARKVRMLTDCVPHQPVSGAISLEAEVLSAPAVAPGPASPAG